MGIKTKCDISRQNFTNSRSTAAFCFSFFVGIWSFFYGGSPLLLKELRFLGFTC